MRQVPEDFQAHLEGRVTTTAQCWRLTRTDGGVLGFTDHDAPLFFDGTAFQAATGLTASEAETALGLASGAQEIEGALSSLAIGEADILAGRYDGARIEVFLVNWERPEQRLLIDVAELGEVTRGGPAFTAELRGIATRLDRQRGRLYRRRCDAVLGDRRCTVDLAVAGRSAETVLLGQAGSGLRVGPVEGDLDRFGRGHLVWLSGAAAGLTATLATAFREQDGTVRLSLLDAATPGAAEGDALRLVVGCDKSFATCRTRFGNGLNFRGFPHLPGNDAAMGIAKPDGRHDGTPLVP